MRTRPLEFLTECAARYGPVVPFRMAAWRAFLVSDPHDIKHVFRDNAANYTKQNIDYRLLRRLVGDGLLANGGRSWQSRRRIAQPALRHEFFMSRVSAATRRATLRLLARWDALEPGATVELTTELAAVVLEIVGDVLLGSDLRDRAASIDRAFTTLNEQFGQWNAATFLPYLWTREVRKCRAARRVLRDTAERILARPPSEAEDLVTLLQRACRSGTLTDRQAADEVVTFLLAGYETTTATLAWTWYLLGQSPAAEARLFAELDAVVGERSPEPDHLPSLPYLHMVLAESMRLYPSVWVISRSPIRKDRVGGFTIPPGALVFVSPYVTHRLDRIWPAADTFRPERFAPGPVTERPAFGYFPFGLGTRQCIGSQLGLTMAQLVMASVARRYRVVSAAGEPLPPVALVTLRPRNGLRARVERRSGTAPSPSMERISS
jgi:cytochrome P450